MSIFVGNEKNIVRRAIFM